MKKIKNLALVAHDNRKKELVEWVEWNFETLMKHNLICTGTTGRMVEATLQEKLKTAGGPGLIKPVTRLKSGPLGGDLQLGALITEGMVDMLFFFWDPMEPHPHDVDVKALLRISVVCNIPIACNRSSADFMISSPMINEAYDAKMNDYSSYISREIEESR